jgi:hypothetical protein
MGRHSASIIGMHQRDSRPSASSAASFVGRVGALALALGIGAAVAGGAGVAHAEGPDASSGSTGQSSPDTSTGSTGATAGTAERSTDTGATDTDTPSTDETSTDDETDPPSNVPTMQLGNGRDADQPVDDEPKTLPELVVGIPEKVVSALAPKEPGGSDSNSPANRGDAKPAEAPRIVATHGAAVKDVVDESVTTVPKAIVTTVVATGGTQPAAAPVSTNVVAIYPVSPTQAKPAPANPIAMVVGHVLSALGISPTAGTGDAPVAPFPILQAALQLVHREIERFIWGVTHIFPQGPSVTIPTNAVPSTAVGVPSPTDDVATPYGDIGKWMLEPNGQIADYGGLPYGGRTVLEPVNVIIVDPTSSSAAESAAKLNCAMFWSGFPGQPFHSTGFRGAIDDILYGQQPTGPLLGFSDNFFLFPNNHGRIFGPDPVETAEGYVWSGAFSTEEFVIYEFLPRHAYVSSNVARNALAKRLIASGQATYGGMVPLNNAYNSATTTTGDHDGYAVVVVLK